jgi:hypothetical protein
LVELLPLYGIVPPKSTYTLTVTTEEKVINLSKGTVFDLVLQSSASGSRYIFLFISRSECDEFFEKTVEMGNTVHELILKAVYAPHGHTTPEVKIAQNTFVPCLPFKWENLLEDTVIFRRLLKHTVRLWLCLVPLQFCGMFAKTHHVA